MYEYFCQIRQVEIIIWYQIDGAQRMGRMLVSVHAS